MRVARISLHSHRHRAHHEGQCRTHAHARDTDVVIDFVGGHGALVILIGNAVGLNLGPRHAEVGLDLVFAEVKARVGRFSKELHDARVFAVSGHKAAEAAFRVTVFRGVGKAVGDARRTDVAHTVHTEVDVVGVNLVGIGLVVA